MKRTNWSTHATFGGTPMVSRYTQQRVAASDHCVAIAKRCPVCLCVYVATPEEPEHGCQQKFVVETAPGLFVAEIDPVTREATGYAKEFTCGVGAGDIRAVGAGQTGKTLTVHATVERA